MFQKEFIGVDCDNVLADTQELLKRCWSAALEGSATQMPKVLPPPSEFLSYMSAKQVRKFFDIFDAHYEECPIVGGAATSTQLLSSYYNIIIMTNRNKKISGGTINYLKKNGISFYDYYGGNSLDKAELAKRYKMKFAVDDDYNIASKIAEYSFVYLFDKPWNSGKAPHENILRVKGWKEILTFEGKK